MLGGVNCSVTGRERRKAQRGGGGSFTEDDTVYLYISLKRGCCGVSTPPPATKVSYKAFKVVRKLKSIVSVAPNCQSNIFGEALVRNAELFNNNFKKKVQDQTNKSEPE